MTFFLYNIQPPRQQKSDCCNKETVSGFWSTAYNTTGDSQFWVNHPDPQDVWYETDRDRTNWSHHKSWNCWASYTNCEVNHILMNYRCGLVTQVVHIPTLNHLSHLFQITYLSDVSQDAMSHAQSKIAGNSRPKLTQNIEELCTAPDVDLVMLASMHPFHASQATLALQAGKHVFIEKPIALTLQDTDLIIAADEKAGGAKVFIGYMRRYASAFEDAVKEVQSLGPIRYARVRDIIGPNSVFVGQSGTFPQTFNDYSNEDSEELRRKTEENIHQALQVELGVTVTKETGMMWQTLSMLGSHDLSAMREMLGMPSGVVGFSPCNTTGSPFWR